MNIKNLQRDKLLFGFFFKEDFTFETNKGVLFNKLKKWLSGDELIYISDKRVGDNLLIKNKPNFKITATKSSFHYENDSRKEDFIKECEEIMSLFKEIFPDVCPVKIGFVQYFSVVNTKNKDSFIRDYFMSGLPVVKSNQVDFHFNFRKDIKGIEHNYNFTMVSDKVTGTLGGTLDLNLSTEYYPELKLSNMPMIFDRLDTYYVNKFVPEFFKIKNEK